MPASIRLGGWAVSTSANIIGGFQAIRAIKAFSRSGKGGSDYFVDGTLESKIFGPEDTLYRVYGGYSGKIGSRVFIKNPKAQITAIRKGALPPGKSTNYITEITFSGNVTAEISRVGPLYRQPG